MNATKTILIICFVIVALISNVHADYVDVDMNYTEDAETFEEVSISEYAFKVLCCVIVSTLFSLWFIKGVPKKKD